MGLGPLTVELLELTRATARARGVPNCCVAKIELEQRQLSLSLSFTLCAVRELLRFYVILDYEFGC